VPAQINMLFRVDGNSTIGMGHAIRCIALANALRCKGAECIFVVSDATLIPTLEENKFDVILLNSPWNNYEISIERFIETI